MQEIDLEKEREEILLAYEDLLDAAKHAKKDEVTLKKIKKSFDLAMDAHKDMRRKSGEPYIYHPIAVAKICAEEIGLGATSIICALLHDTVEDTEVSLEDIETLFGKKEALIINGLTKISEVIGNRQSIQAENFRKILLTLSEDVRVILIKLADRLHNMRTLGSMKREKQLKIASETLFLYAPLAHRLGLHTIKSELEDLCLKYQEPEKYEEIKSKLKKTDDVRERFIKSFSSPIIKELEERGLKFEMKGRPKSIFSIWNKMQKQEVDFEQVYDVFAIRIILDSQPEDEKSDCWKAYSIVTDFYQPNPERLRDWISVPKANGYESLHTTVVSPSGKWVEVQIRTERMDDIAEKGFAAHWKYKEGGGESLFDKWINQVRELIENPDANALELIDEFKLNLYSEDIYAFTPKGDLITLPVGACSLDFAFAIHSQVGSTCLGAKVNNKLVPLSSVLSSGDQVEVLTSSNQTPKKAWLKFVKTHKAKATIKSVLKAEKRELADEGKLMLEKEFKRLKINYVNLSLKELQRHYKVSSPFDLYYRIAEGVIDLDNLKNFEVKKGVLRHKTTIRKRVSSYIDQLRPGTPKKEEPKKNLLLIGDTQEELDYTLSPCCNPIPGDEVFGFVTIKEGIKIHKINCPNAVQLMSNYSYRIVNAHWTGKEELSFLAGLKVTGIDEVGMVNKITQIISSQLHVNMKSISFESNDGVFEGNVMAYVNNTTHLDELIEKLENVAGVINVSRFIGE
ncbi:bifunctional (p)ppGpp synthetase/guanosine-3',5'-bis(diphosphate) 3'-pyrophosphohydrolase [bacterium]|nr:bifunctional (p)ppGpp synthetase/guanosine-3',5'-bis(diphosphate) 3'-pyrophosphohydrolase [bacterium]